MRQLEMNLDVKKEDANIIVYEKKRTIKYEVTNVEIKKLRPISIIDNVAWILVNLPTRQTITDDNENTTTNLHNHPYFVTSEKKLINVRSSKLSDKFQLPNFMLNANVRWEKSDIDKYLTQTETVDIKNAFEHLRNHVSKLIELKSLDYLNVCLIWSLGTYFYKIFEHYPYLDFNATKGSGKSKALSILECICYNAYMTYHLTGPAWTRMVESQGCTLLIDEQEDLQDPEKEHSENLTAILRAAFKTDAQSIINTQTKGSSWMPKIYDVGVPVSLAHIKPLHEITADRTIPIPMLKSTNPEINDADVNKDDEIWTVVRNSMYRMFLDNFKTIQKIKDEKIDLPNISSRDRNQIWKPIITLAKFLERNGVEGLVDSVLRVVEATHIMRTATNQSSNTDVQILELLCESIGDKIRPVITKEGDTNWFSQQRILKAARGIPDLEYLSSKELGGIFVRLGFVKKKKNPNGMCVFITENILKILCEKHGLDFKELTAHKAHLAQSDAQSATSD